MRFSLSARPLLAACALFSCSAPVEARRVSLPFGSATITTNSVTTADGYAVTLTEARVAVHDFTFSVGGEAHTTFLERVNRWLLPAAHAHPGHYQDGAVTGELRGRYIVDLLHAAALGDATLIVGAYESTSFGLRRSDSDDALASADPLTGHTAFLRGTAARNGIVIDFTAEIDSPTDRAITGVPFETAVGENDGGTAIVIELLLEDPYEHDTLFDGIYFSELDTDDDKAVSISVTNTDPAAYDTLRRNFQTHDHFRCRRAAQD